MTTTSTNVGGWASSDMRIHCLGGDNNSSPLPNTLMASLPVELRTYMKAMNVWTNNEGGGTDGATISSDYLSLPSEYEIYGVTTYSCPAEAQHQQQYAYYASGNGKIKYRHDTTTSPANWWERSPRYQNSNYFCVVSTAGTSGTVGARYSYGISPIFRI